MIITGHLLVGGAIGVGTAALCSSPTISMWAVPLALAFGVLSHHLLDFLPHTDAATFWPEPRRVPLGGILIVALEVALGCSLTAMLFVAQHSTWAFALGAIGGALPDLLDEIPLWQEWFRRSSLGAIWHRWHLRLHCADMGAWWRTGLVIDALVVGGGLWLLLNV